MANYTKTRLIDLRCNLNKLAEGDILTAYQASNIGWSALRERNLECVELPTDKPNQRFVRLQPLSIEISGCTSWKRP